MNLEKESRWIKESVDISETGISCLDMMKKMIPVMKEISEEEMDEMKWLTMIYQYCVSTYFPGNFLRISNKKIRRACRFYLQSLKNAIEEEQKICRFNRCRDFEFLTVQEERDKSDIQEEYQHFKKIVEELYICEFMRVARECTPFDTLGHIAGVHFVAMHIARQIAYNTLIKIDIGLVSAAAFIHDIGKFGCRDNEAGRVPYLHYYYTQQFAQRFDMGIIGHIAANHSTWDLELENLSIENLLLIYADFRVKSIRNKKGEEEICFWTLDESYRIILDKLDNVDDKKRNRYKKVFQKLKDFEKFLCSLGISTDLDKTYAGTPEEKHLEFLDTQEIGEKIRHKAIQSNIMVMNTINNFSAFVGLLEEAKGEKDWRNVRAYLNVLDEYSTYMTCRQKKMVLSFLYEMLMNRDGDIRRQAAHIMGKIIAGYEIKYQKEIPKGEEIPFTGESFLEIWDQTLHSMLIVDHKITQQHRRWIGYSMKNVFLTVMEKVEEEKRYRALQVLIKYYEYSKWDLLSRFILMDCASVIMYKDCLEAEIKILNQFAIAALSEKNKELQMTALRFFYIWTNQGWRANEESREYIKSWIEEHQDLPIAFQYLMAGIGKRLFARKAIMTRFNINQQEVSVLFMENQKMDTPWIYKLVNMEILNMYYRQNNRKQCFQWAAHLVNILQTSDRIVIRHQAGRYLIALISKLTYEQRYEVAAELVKGLEIGQYSVSKYIPEYLGKLFFELDKEAQKEFLKKYKIMIDGRNHKVAIVTLETIGITMQHFYSFKNNKRQSDKKEWQREQMEGLLLRGMAHYIDEISQEAFYILGHSIFGSDILTIEEKAKYFYSMGKKMLLLMQSENKSFYLYNNAAALNHIYRFLTDYYMRHGELIKIKEKKVAFFPGTFDPFSKGHREVVKEIKRHGFTVFLALDEFSWSKRTQPYKIRRKIMEMSVADLRNVYLFPSDIPINIANPRNLKLLADIFSGQSLYIAVGSDVVNNASAYRKEKEDYSIHNFNHVILQRTTRKKLDKKEVKKKITGEILYLNILEKGESISSTRIRDNLDLNRDISNLIEINAQNYIYEEGLYIREPGYRLVTETKAVHTIIEKGISDEVREELSLSLLKQNIECFDRENVIFIRDESYYNQIMGCIFFHTALLSELYEETGSEETAMWLRKEISGKVAVISSIHVRKMEDFESNKQIVFSELMAHLLEKEYTYVLCRKKKEDEEFLYQQGFLDIEINEEWLLLDIRRPLVLFADLVQSIKNPFAENAHIQNTIIKSRKKLQKALTELYPGNLVLLMDLRVVNYKLVSMIKKENEIEQLSDQEKWGKKMCVPFGKILKGVQIPGTVTKELNTEKVYGSDMKEFIIREYPNYADLETQIKTIKAFKRPVIMVDNLFHKGYRMSFISPYLEKEKVDVSKIIVSVLSGIGKDIARKTEKNIDCAYFIPNMRSWFIESDFYPFIGGDSIEKEGRQTKILPSVNPILPYQIPCFLENISGAALYKLSEACLENTQELLEAMENIYQKKMGRKLIIGRLGEVLFQSRYPDCGGGNFEEENKMPSQYIKYEYKRLKRMNRFMIYGEGEGKG